MSPRTRRYFLIVTVALVAWYGVGVVPFALRPLSDAVPIGVDWSPTLKNPPKAQRQISQNVECNSLFDGSARDGSPLPALAVQPTDKPVLSYSRTACVNTQQQARIVFALDTLFLLAALTGLFVLYRRLNRLPAPPPMPVITHLPLPS